MLTLNSRQLREKLPTWLRGRLAVLLAGPPGTGKTWMSRRVASETFGEALVEVLDGGNESEWKGLFPYKTPSGTLELGKALRASGYQILEDKLVKASTGGALIIDESNRVPPELKTQFQLLASERIVPWPDGGTVPLDVAIVATANDSDLGVEESSRAELDRYDLVIRLFPSPEEQAKIVAGEAGVRPEIAQAVYEAVIELGAKLDPKKFHLPEGLRLAISIARLLRAGNLGPTDIFRGAAERCFPLGRRGAEKHRAEFDGAVMDCAGRFAGKLANLGAITAEKKTVPNQQGRGVQKPQTLHDLATDLRDSTLTQISAGPLPLPRRFNQMMHVFIASFGFGATKWFEKTVHGHHQRVGVEVKKESGEKPDSVEFKNADRHRVETFCRLCAGL